MPKVKLIANNSVWHISTQYSLNAVNGTNHDGIVVRFHNKRTNQEITIPLPVFRKTSKAVEESGD